MRKFYLSCKFCTLTIILSEVVLPGHIAFQIIVFGKERLRNVLNTSQRRVNKNSLTWWYALKTSWRYLCKTSWRHLEDVLKMFFKTSWRRLGKTSWRCVEDLSKTSSKRLEDSLKMSWRRFCKTFWRRLEDVLKTSWRHLEDAWLRQIYWSLPRRLEDVFWRRKAKASIFVLIKTSSEGEDERSSSRRMFAGHVYEKTSIHKNIVQNGKNTENKKYPNFYLRKLVKLHH